MNSKSINWPVDVLNRLVGFTEDICDLTENFDPSPAYLKNYVEICSKGSSLFFHLKDKQKELDQRSISLTEMPMLSKTMDMIFSQYPVATDWHAKNTILQKLVVWGLALEKLKKLSHNDDFCNSLAATLGDSGDLTKIDWRTNFDYLLDFNKASKDLAEKINAFLLRDFRKFFETGTKPHENEVIRHCANRIRNIAISLNVSPVEEHQNISNKLIATMIDIESLNNEQVSLTIYKPKLSILIGQFEVMQKQWPLTSKDISIKNEQGVDKNGKQTAPANITGMSWTKAQAVAEEYVEKHGYPGLNELAKIVGCASATIKKATSKSQILKNAERAKNNCNTLSAVNLSDAVLETTEQTTELQPDEEADRNMMIEELIKKLPDNKKKATELALSLKTSDEIYQLHKVYTEQKASSSSSHKKA